MAFKKSNLKSKSNGECNDHEMQDSILQQGCGDSGTITGVVTNLNNTGK